LSLLDFKINGIFSTDFPEIATQIPSLMKIRPVGA